MKSPFAIFRKHQNVLMVVLTGLAMFAFVILDPLTQNLSAAPPLLGFVFGLGLAWFFSRKSKALWLWLAVGGVAGGLLGNQLVNNVGSSSHVVASTLGRFNENQLLSVYENQRVVNSFLSQAMRAAYEGDQNAPAPQQLQGFLFGGGGDHLQEGLAHLLLMAEAKKLKMEVNDAQVSSYIDRATSNKLSKRDFNRIVAQHGISGKEIYDLLREQMVARNVQALLVPRPIASPESYWNAYQKLNLRQELALAPIAVESFFDQVGEPTEADLKAMFDKYRNDFPGQSGPGAPGFRQPGRIQIGYVKIGYEDVEKTIPAITDAEIEAYYAANQEEFRNITPEFPGELPAGMSEDLQLPANPTLTIPGDSVPAPAGEAPAMPAEQGSEKPEGSEKPAEKPAEKSEDKKEEAKTSEPASPAKPGESSATEKPEAGKPAGESQEKPAEKPAEGEKPAPEAPVEGEKQSGMSPLGNAFASIQDEKPAAPAESPAPAAEAKPDDAAKPAEGEAKADSKPETKPEGKGEEKPQSEEKKEEKPADSSSAPPSAEGAAPAMNAPELPEPAAPLPEFKPLDDTLREEIRQRILMERTLERLQALSDEVSNEIVNVGGELVEVSDRQRPAAVKKLKENLLEITKKRNLEYLETQFLSSQEIEDSEEYPLGRLTEPVSNPFERPRARTFVQQHFGVSDVKALIAQQFRPMISEDPSTLDRYVHWQIDFNKAHTPEWNEPGIQDQVKAAWKLQQAQELAQKRAEEVAQILRTSEKPWAEAVPALTETGKEGGRTLNDAYTEEFSWVSRSAAPQVNFFMPPQLEITQIPLVLGGVDNDFMRVVFEDLESGEIGTAWGADRKYIFVARVENRGDLEQLRADFINLQSTLFFPNSPYQMLVSEDAQEVRLNWTEDLYERYQVQWNQSE